MNAGAPAPAHNGKSNYVPGLEGIVAAQTRLSRVDGDVGELVIAGYPIEALAAQASFEEVAYLLWNDALPNRRQLDGFRATLSAQRALPPITLDLLQAAARQRLPVMDALRMAAGTLSLSDAGGATPAELRATGIGILARLPIIVAAYWRLRQGQTPIAPRADLGEAANYLYMLFGERAGGRTRARLRDLPEHRRRSWAQCLHLHSARYHLHRV